MVYNLKKCKRNNKINVRPSSTKKGHKKSETSKKSCITNKMVLLRMNGRNGKIICTFLSFLFKEINHGMILENGIYKKRKKNSLPAQTDGSDQRNDCGV